MICLSSCTQISFFLSHYLFWKYELQWIFAVLHFFFNHVYAVLHFFSIIMYINDVTNDTAKLKNENNQIMRMSWYYNMCVIGDILKISCTNRISSLQITWNFLYYKLFWLFKLEIVASLLFYTLLVWEKRSDLKTNNKYQVANQNVIAIIYVEKSAIETKWFVIKNFLKKMYRVLAKALKQMKKKKMEENTTFSRKLKRN